ncbi:MAG: hypothetical protein Ct9H300mP27_10570 [Chloroflexota bacterium]|nr:MAG: hypothetical protein Ct9H300mP27_10570 [Chloroflexota bacterium]
MLLLSKIDMVLRFILTIRGLVEQEISIMDQERSRFPDEANLLVPDFMKKVIGEVTVQARQRMRLISAPE